MTITIPRIASRYPWQPLAPRSDDICLSRSHSVLPADFRLAETRPYFSCNIRRFCPSRSSWNGFDLGWWVYKNYFACLMTPGKAFHPQCIFLVSKSPPNRLRPLFFLATSRHGNDRRRIICTSADTFKPFPERRLVFCLLGLRGLKFQ